MKTTLANLALIAVLSVPTTSFAQEGEGRRLALLAFSALDTADRGYIDQGEYSDFGDNVFISMDGDDNKKLSLGEFLSWDYGMLPLAQERGREAAYETALRVVFAFWDRNADGMISKTEHRLSLDAGFRRADINHDATLTDEEFTSGFPVMVALRAAINPAPVE